MKNNDKILEKMIGDLRKLYREGNVKPEILVISAEQFDALCDLPAEVAGLRILLRKTEAQRDRVTEAIRKYLAGGEDSQPIENKRRPHEARGSAASNACLGAY